MKIIKNIQLANALISKAPAIMFNSKNLTSKDKIQLSKKLADSILKIDNVKIEVVNSEYLKNINGCLILSNHQDNRDIWALYSALGLDIRFVAKKELFKIPLLSNFMKIGQSYSLDREDAMASIRTLKQAINDINNENANTVVFPEGTRSKGPFIKEFNSGIFSIFKKCQKPIIPVYIDKSYDKNTKVIKVCIGKPIQELEIKALGTKKLKKEVTTQIYNLRKENSTEKKFRIAIVGQKEEYKKFLDTLNAQSLLESVEYINDINELKDYDLIVIDNHEKLENNYISKLNKYLVIDILDNKRYINNISSNVEIIKYGLENNSRDIETLLLEAFSKLTANNK
ncbi:lysophospholipid acyltransferase family protein [Mycoplasma sp. P36-A1]|uniref:lysophospholipid acyltransferase family protein n=1 Tax=Mycoplasma sp. P36-A1 TaxID=3252900 RepID=UPI003C2D0FB5